MEWFPVWHVLWVDLEMEFCRYREREMVWVGATIRFCCGARYYQVMPRDLGSDSQTVDTQLPDGFSMKQMSALCPFAMWWLFRVSNSEPRTRDVLCAPYVC